LWTRLSNWRAGLRYESRGYRATGQEKVMANGDRIVKFERG
jgi:hypothetical protein